MASPYLIFLMEKMKTLRVPSPVLFGVKGESESACQAARMVAGPQRPVEDFPVLPLLLAVPAGQVCE